MTSQLKPIDYLQEVPGALSAPPAKVLFVDLDGTVIATDLLWESALLAVKNWPLDLLRIPVWLLRGRAHLKRELARRVSPDVGYLPFRQDVLEFLKEQRANGWKLILATASDQLLAGKVAEELGLFDDGLCNDGKHNLKGRAKLEAIQAYCRQHGVTEFAYLADARADLPIWRQAQQVYVVAPRAALLGLLKRLDRPLQVIGKPDARGPALLKALRPHQWVKNLLLVVPLLLAHATATLDKVFALAVAFLAFSACASSVYLLNDLLDLEADRHHPVKRRRPFACGALPLAWGPGLILGLLALAFAVSLATLPPGFTGLLTLYLGCNFAYSGWLKRKAMADVLLLAGLYALRVLAGGVAADIPVSEWLLAFSLFFFISLAFAKRYSELNRLARSEAVEARGRAYQVSDMSLIESMGPNSGLLAVLVLALYINSQQVKLLYKHGDVLWLLCPLLLYWISRVWFLAKRGLLAEDPVIFALKDRVSLGIGGLALALLMAAAWWS